MIDISNLKVSFGKSRVLNIASLSFQKSGLYGLVGPSGCGKTTLVNVLNGAQKFEGNVVVDGQQINLFNQKDRLKYRMSTIAVCYQDAILFDDLSVSENILLKLDFYPTISKRRQMARVDQLLKALRLFHLKDQKSQYLSGGEKARVNIIRTLINQAKVMIFDEPTAALDEESSHLVFNLLAQFARHHTVIVVSHNRDLIKTYASSVIDLSYGQVTKISTQESVQSSSELTGRLQLGQASQPRNFKLFRLGLLIFKSRRRRNMFATFTFTVSLSAICALLVLTTTISTGIKQSFQLNYQEDTALLSYKMSEPYPYQQGLNKEQAQLLADKYEAKLGVKYLSHVDELFPELNVVYFQNESIKLPLPSFTASSFQHIQLVEEINLLDIFGYRKASLHDDELILVLPNNEIRYIYDHLNLRKGLTLERLGEYLKINETAIVLNVAHNEWGYEDEQIFRLAGVVAGDYPTIIHSNPLFSEVVFETKMALKGSVELSKIEEWPWTLKKIFYLYKKNNESILYQEINNPSVLLARSIKTSVASTYDSHYHNNRLMLYVKPPTYMPLPFQKEATSYPLVRGGLTSIEEALMIGFSDNFLLGVSQEQLAELISYDEMRTIGDTKTLLMGPRMVNGHVNLSLGDGLTYVPLGEKVSIRTPPSLKEIVVSSGLYQHLFDYSFDASKNNKVYVATPRSTRLEGDYIKKEYVTISLTVVGVIEDSRFMIAHDAYWPILFFKDVVKMDPFSLVPTGLISTDNQLIKNFSQHQDFIVSYPFATFSATIEQTITQMMNLIYIIAFSSLLMAFIVVYLVLQTLIDDFYQHFSLLYLFGMSRPNIIKIGIYSISFVVMLALLSSWMTTIGVEVMISQLIFKGLSVFQNMIPYLIVVFIAIFGLIPGVFLLIFKVKTLKLCALSKRNL